MEPAQRREETAEETVRVSQEVERMQFRALGKDECKTEAVRNAECERGQGVGEAGRQRPCWVPVPRGHLRSGQSPRGGRVVGVTV